MDTTYTIIKFIGGLGLFIYGMKLMSDGLENVAGKGLRYILEKVTSNRIIGVAIGIIITAIIQSSSTTTVMVVGFVNTGLMNLSQALGVIMGSNIGSSITAQLIAFRLDQIAPLFIFIGAATVIFAKVEERIEIGNIILGFGILFTGMGAMINALGPISSTSEFSQLILALDDNWVIGILAGLTITTILQSSSATTGILIALASTNNMTINLAIPIIFGCNIGTCIITMLSSIGSNKTAHKAALLHLIFNLTGTIIFIPFIGYLGNFISTTSTDISRQIANAHIIFNITNTALLLPFSNYLINFVNKVIPCEEKVEKMGSKFIDDRFLETPVIASGQVLKETIRMANKAKKNVELSMNAFLNNDENLIKQVYENENLINILEESITNYLVKLSKCALSDKDKVIVASTFHIIIDIERIGDHAKNIVDLTLEKKNRKLKYSSNALDEINEIYEAVMNSLNVAIISYATRNIDKAKSVYEIDKLIDSYQKDSRERHIQRIYNGLCNAYEGAIFLDLIADLKRIGDHSINIAESVIDNYID